MEAIGRLNHKLFPRSASFWICALALASMALVVVFHSLVTNQAISVRDTWLPILMGLLGSSMYVMYNLYGPGSGLLRSEGIRNPIKKRNAPRIFVRLFLGPLAGWLSYAIVVGQLGGQIGKGQPTNEYTFLWLPFLAGFSSDLLIGIVSQIEKAIKVTLGIGYEEKTNQQIERQKDDPAR